MRHTNTSIILLAGCLMILGILLITVLNHDNQQTSLKRSVDNRRLSSPSSIDGERMAEGGSTPDPEMDDVKQLARGFSQESEQRGDIGGLTVQGNQGARVDANLGVLAIDDAVVKSLENDAGIQASEIRGLPEFSAIHLSKDSRWVPDKAGCDQFFVYCQADGYYVDTYFLTLQQINRGIILHLDPCPVTTLNVQDRAGNPLPGIDVYFGPDRSDPKYFDMAWKERLSLSFFLESLETDQAGRASLHTPLRSGMSVVVYPSGNYASTTVSGIQAGETRTIRLGRACSFKGTVTDQDGEPLEGVAVLFLVGSQGIGTTTIGGATTDHDGVYVADSVAVEEGMVDAVAFLDGYVLAHHFIRRLRPGELVPLDFELHRAVKLRGKVYTAGNRDPIAGLKLLLRSGSTAWVPGRYFTDSKGFFETGKLLQAGGRYQLLWYFGDFPLPAAVIEVPLEDPYYVDIPLPGFSSLKVAVDASGESAGGQWEIRYRPEAYPSAYVDLENGEEHALIPEGPGTLVCRGPKGRILVRELVLEPGEKRVISIGPPDAELSFTVPMGGKSQSWTFQLFGPSGEEGREWKQTDGTVRIQVDPGKYSLLLRDSSGHQGRVGPFIVPEKGLDLGEVRIGCCSITGTLESDASLGSGVLLVDLCQPGGNVLSTAEIRDGRFAFQGLAPGKYILSLDPNRTQMGNYCTTRISVDLAEIGSVERVAFHLSSTENVLRGHLLPPPDQTVRVLSFTRGGWYSDLVAPSGAFSIPAKPEEDAELGFIAWQGNQASWVRVTVSQPSPELSLEWQGGDELEVQLKDGGHTLGSERWQLLWRGYVLPGEGRSDTDGILRIRSNGYQGLSLRLPSQGVTVPVDPFLLSGFLDLASLDAVARFTVVDFLKHPIPGVSVLDLGNGELAYTDRDGVAVLKDAVGDEVRISCTGYWADGLKSRGDDLVVLRRTAGPVTVTCADGLAVERIALVPDFRLVHPLEPTIREVARHKEWVVRDLPEGDYRLDCFDDLDKRVRSIPVLVNVHGATVDVPLHP